MSNTLLDNDINDNSIPKGLQKLEPSQLIINNDDDINNDNDSNDDDDDNNDIIQVDKFRFKVSSSDLKKAIEMRTSLNTKQISNSNNNDINDINLQLSPEMVDLLSKVDIEEVNGVKKLSLRIDSSELDNLISGSDGDYIYNDEDDDHDDSDDYDDYDNDSNIEEAVNKYYRDNSRKKSVKPATFYGDESRLESLVEKKQRIDNTKLKPVNWWFAGLGKYELSSDLIGTSVLLIGLSVVTTVFDTFAKSIQQFSQSIIMQALRVLKIDKFIQKKFIPICLIGCMLGTLLQRYLKMKKDHRYDGIGYRA